MNHKKAIVIPGWMNRSGMYIGGFDFHEIWQDEIFPESKLKKEWVVGHSVGANWALLNWRENPQNKLILVNPLLVRRNLLGWFLKWIKFHIQEKRPETKEVIKNFKKRIFGIKLIIRMLRFDYDKILKKISKENIIIIKGKQDNFYMDKKAMQYIKSFGIKTIEVNAGHDWNEKIVLEIERIVEN